ncbi:MAG: MinD/ParA family protein [Candidatus Thorarchaeota archaeon]
MTVTWSFNSYKGGTGKTNTSLNTAVQLTREGNNVCLLDFDFLGPALFAIFGTRDRSYLNQAFYEEAEIEDVLFPYESPPLNREGGNLLVGLADPRPETISKVHNYTDDDHREAFARIIETQEIIEDDFQVDYIIIDTGPGLRRDVANAMIISNAIALILKPTLADLEGTKLVVTHMLQGFRDKFLGLIMNRTLDRSWQSHATLASADAEYNVISENLHNFALEKDVFILADIPCYCDIARSQSDKIIILEHPTHPFSQAIADLAKNVIQKSNGD